MCSIIVLRPKQMIDQTALYNACYNNWHSYGLVIKTKDGLDIKKKVPESGEVDPAEVYKLLQENFEYERYLHLRHNTAGATNLENTHPFEVYYDPKKKTHVVFMHNGTMYEYKSKITKNGIVEDDPDGPSDTKNFVDRILTPYTASADFGNGRGDIQAPLFVNLIKKMWPTTAGNRGLLISSSADPLFIGDWKEFGEDGQKFPVSNLDYFDKVQRGPEHTRRLVREEKEKREREEKARAERKDLAVRPFMPETPPGGSVLVSDLRSFKDKIDHKKDFFELSHSCVNIMQDWDVYEREGAVTLGAATYEELKELYKSEADCLLAMDLVFSDYAKLYCEFKVLEEKHDKATKHIASLIEANKKLRSNTDKGVRVA